MEYYISRPCSINILAFHSKSKWRVNLINQLKIGRYGFVSSKISLLIIFLRVDLSIRRTLSELKLPSMQFVFTFGFTLMYFSKSDGDKITNSPFNSTV